MLLASGVGVGGLDPERPVVALRFKRRALECIGHSWDCPCGRSGPHAGADFTVPNDVFRTDSHFQASFNNEERGRPRPDRVGRRLAITCRHKCLACLTRYQ